MSFGIHAVEIDRGGPEEAEFRRVRVRFGDDHELEVVASQGQSRLRLHSRDVTATLSACGPLCQYERAVNLLRLHMPDTS